MKKYCTSINLGFFLGEGGGLETEMAFCVIKKIKFVHKFMFLVPSIQGLPVWAHGVTHCGHQMELFCPFAGIFHVYPGFCSTTGNACKWEKSVFWRRKLQPESFKIKCSFVAVSTVNPCTSSPLHKRFLSVITLCFCLRCDWDGNHRATMFLKFACKWL